MSLDLPPHVFHVRLMYRSWLPVPDWLCTLSHGTSQSLGEALDPDLAYEIALAKAKNYVSEVRKPSFSILIEL